MRPNVDAVGTVTISPLVGRDDHPIRVTVIRPGTTIVGAVIVIHLTLGARRQFGALVVIEIIVRQPGLRAVRICPALPTVGGVYVYAKIRIVGIIVIQTYVGRDAWNGIIAGDNLVGGGFPLRVRVALPVQRRRQGVVGVQAQP